MIDESDITLRLAACDLVRTRFAGRAALRTLAERDNLEALEALELRLGLITEAQVLHARRVRITRWLVGQLAPAQEIVLYTRPNIFAYTDATNEAIGYLLAGDDYETRERIAAQRYAIGNEATKRTARMVAPDACARIDSVRKQRAARDSADPRARDPLAREPGYAARAIALRRAAELVGAAGYRTATHSHDTHYTAVQIGNEFASSESGKATPRSVGLSNAYAQKAYFVATSSHIWGISTAILTSEVRALNAAAPDGIVYLSLTTRVRQGRGTSLVVEHPTARGAWRADR